ncbi:MAG: hypothetical protein ACOCXH_15150 [Cyclobacteriaceae bacterium]
MKTKQFEVQIWSRDGVFYTYIGATVRAQVYSIAQSMYPNATIGTIRKVG